MKPLGYILLTVGFVAACMGMLGDSLVLGPEPLAALLYVVFGGFSFLSGIVAIGLAPRGDHALKS